MITVNKKEIKRKKEVLAKCKIFLKKEFIGIDEIIDNLLDYIQIWYLMPEILNRPIIINLWGMTGVGKTDLIRKMVKFLEFQDRFVEIELSNIDQSNYETTVSQILNNNNLQDEKPAIILFDEIQRFNTLDSDGEPLPQTKFTDFWELLSDGRLSKKSKENLDYYLYNYMFNQRDNEARKKRGEEISENAINPWQAQELKNTLGLDNVESLMNFSEKDLIDLILTSKKHKKIYEPVNKSKTLIIISGNLDEAYNMANKTSEADIDADIFHSFTKKITLVDIKNALSKKFRPEQVARFGNIHLIYNSLKKSDFQLLIQREINRIIKETEKNLGIKLEISKYINQLIYSNGVFPVQGVRPVFSSIIDILEANLSKFIYEAIITEQSTIYIDYSLDQHKILAKIGSKKIEIPYVGRIDKIRDANEIDAVANISVHECGHAIAYMILMGMAPLQLKSKVASSYAAGFTFPHDVHETKESLINKIKIYLAGGIAEEIVFGKENASVGRSADRESVTVIATDFVRRFGFDEEFQATYNIENYPYRLDQKVTDQDIEKMITKLVGETKELLIQNEKLLLELSTELCMKGSMEAKEVAAIGNKFGFNTLVKEEGFLHISDYYKKLKK